MNSIKKKNLTILKRLKRVFTPNIWWFMVFVAVFIGTVCIFASKTSSAVSVYPQFSVVGIDAGHGGIDVGASAFGVTESELNLAVATKLNDALSEIGVKTVMTRTGDYGLYGTTLAGFKLRDMIARKEICESAGCNLLVSVHMNASTLTDRSGVVIYCDFDDEYSRLLADSIASQFEDCVVKDGDFYITTKIDTPAVIVECGFITTQWEAELLQTESYQQDIANNIARGVLIYQRSVSP